MGLVPSLMLNNLLFSKCLHFCYLLYEGGQYEKEGAIYDEDARNNEKRHETRQEHGYAESYGHRIQQHLSPFQSSNNGGNDNRCLRGSPNSMRFREKSFDKKCGSPHYIQ